MGIFTKLRDFVGLNEPQDYEYEYDEADVDDYQSIYEEEKSCCDCGRGNSTHPQTQ
jgi:cell division inhibitor SepF